MESLFLHKDHQKPPIVKVPLQFYFEPVEIISKELTKLNCSSEYRIHYLGPRWDNSYSLHKVLSKKHGYQFDDRSINNNSTFFSEQMGNNQFYKNQVYYRAFQGMNPTIDHHEQLRFDSKFQSGNLDCVIKVDQKQYDLFLRVDSNTRGHLFWFYFQVSNAIPDTEIKFNICNMTKSMQLYEKGFKPYSSIVSENGDFQRWTQDRCKNITIQKKNFRYNFVYEKIKVRPLYELSFAYKFKDDKPVRFAYCIPYTYTKMIKDIHSFTNQEVSVGVIGRSLTGIDIPVVKIGLQQQDVYKPVVAVIGRAHPAQSNGSYTVHGFIKYICQSPDALYLRKKVIFIIVPMLNPDGVILGNSRTGASGKDLNRQFKTKNRHLFSEVDAIKRLISQIQLSYDIEVFLDFHGHSRKKNMFLFGPNYNITQSQYYKARIMPKYLSQLTHVFRYYGCIYSIPPCKLTTARAVMLNQMGIPFVYTIETSVGQYYDQVSHKDKPFTAVNYVDLGGKLGKAISSYFQSVEQYEQYLSSRKNESESLEQPNKKRIPQISKNDRQSSTPSHKAPHNKKINAHDLKIFKIIEQIKVLEERKMKKREDPPSDDASSDSQDENDDLEKNKMFQFEGMVTQGIQVENLREQRMREMNEPKKIKNQPIKPLNNKKKKPLNTNTNLQMKQLIRSIEKNEVKVTPQFNHRQTKSLQVGSSYQTQPKALIISKQQNHLQQQNEMISSAFLLNRFQNRKQKNPKNDVLNLRMFNFSEMIEQNFPRTITCKKNKRYGLNLESQQKRQQISLDGIEFAQRNDSVSPFNTNLYKMNLETNILGSQTPIKDKFYSKNQKQRGVFPAHFYRIKYQNHQRKKQKIFEQKQTIIAKQQPTDQVKRSKRKGLGFLNIKKVSQD